MRDKTKIWEIILRHLLITLENACSETAIHLDVLYCPDCCFDFIHCLEMYGSCLLGVSYNPCCFNLFKFFTNSFFRASGVSASLLRQAYTHFLFNRSGSFADCLHFSTSMGSNSECMVQFEDQPHSSLMKDDLSADFTFRS